MVFQVLINYNDKKNKPLCVADTQEEFNNTTIRELKEKFESQIPGAPGPDDVRVIFGRDLLEDHQTLQFYRINHLSVLLFVIKMPGGGDQLKLGSSFASSGAQKEKIQERDSASQYKGATKPRSDADQYDRAWRSINWSKDRQNHLTTITNFQLRIPEVNALRILLHGPVGAGKSSFFSSVNDALQARITTRALANASNDEKSFTLKCTTYKVKKDRTGSYFPFTFTDIAGMHNSNSGIQTDDIIQLLNGHIHDGYTFNPLSPITKKDPKYKRKPTLKDKIHCLAAVLPASTVSLINEDIIRQMKVVRKKAKVLGIPQVIIMTKVDEVCPLVKDNLEKIYTSKKIKQKMEECSVKLGVPVNCIFPVKNYHEENTTNTTADILILDALKNIVHFASDYVEDQANNNNVIGTYEIISIVFFILLAIWWWFPFE